MTQTSRSRWLIGGALVVVVIALAAIALNREPVLLDPDTPGGVVQGYLQAISDEDYETALEHLDMEYYEGCDAAAIARSAPREPFTATLDEAELSGESDKAWVPATLRFGGDGPLDSGWASYEEFRLVDEDGTWLITGEAWPYFGWDCREEI